MVAQERDLGRLPSVVVLIRTRKEEHEVLLVRHGPKVPSKEGIYGFPGGRPNPGESAEEAALREFEEETGLEITPDNLIPFPGAENIYTGVNRRNNKNKPYSIRIFSVRNPDLVSGSLRKSYETIPVWARVRTLSRRRPLLMPSVEKIVADKINHNND